jgi:chemotaxis protein CheD
MNVEQPLTHFILPHGPAGTDDARFANVAVPRLAARLRALGCHMLVAKVFGGAAVLAMGNAATVGYKNTEAAEYLLREEGIGIVAQRTGGDRGIVLQYYTSTGAVRLREIKGQQLQAEDTMKKVLFF